MEWGKEKRRNKCGLIGRRRRREMGIGGLRGGVTRSSAVGGGGQMRGETFPLAHIKDIKKKTNRKTCLT